MGTNITTISGRGSLDFPQYYNMQYRNFPFLKKAGIFLNQNI
ncbi:hypothetical protein SpAn4DRAFT_5196 [Sporomusa ovata]|uniref:Uncharacterized protein n=1 Tax=Sporomusa ovata TaxID=2378 RepID=A0A0U1L1W5_9FIRM|nr:hypothetical protein SpAn4DRAFT_5196 [Sporomusa ovata]